MSLLQEILAETSSEDEIDELISVNRKRKVYLPNPIVFPHGTTNVSWRDFEFLKT